MSYVERWSFEDTETPGVGPNEVVRLPINPNAMSSPTVARSMQWAWGNRSGGLNRPRGIDAGQSSPTELTFGGVIVEKSHYDLLLDWSTRARVLRVTDHLGRTFEIIIQRFEPIERQATPARKWRADYTMSCLMLKEVL